VNATNLKSTLNQLTAVGIKQWSLGIDMFADEPIIQENKAKTLK
jgi:hypothetical protein